jgi:hypothetical protein
MKLFQFSLPLLAVLSVVSCRSQSMPDDVSDLQSKASRGDDSAGQNFPPFDAFKIWSTGKGLKGTKGVFEYPANYDSPRVPSGTQPDGVFYDDTRFSEGTDTDVDDWDGWRGEPTDGVKEEDGVLMYPSKSGRKLKLRFSEISDDNEKMTHVEAKNYCESKNMRLPTIMELFDYCVAEKDGVKQVNKSKNHANEKIADRFPNNRCVSSKTQTDNLLKAPVDFIWSASVTMSGSARVFRTRRGDIGSMDRSFIGVRTVCVGN